MKHLPSAILIFCHCRLIGLSITFFSVVGGRFRYFLLYFTRPAQGLNMAGLHLLGSWCRLAFSLAVRYKTCIE